MSFRSFAAPFLGRRLLPTLDRRNEPSLMGQDEDRGAADVFVRILGTSIAEAKAIVAAGHLSLEEVAYVPITEFLEINSIRKERLLEVRRSARLNLKLSDE